MFYNKQIEILPDKAKERNEYGDMVSTDIIEAIKPIDCDVQPISQDRVKKDYGIDKEVKWQIFCDTCNEIKINKIIRYEGNNYRVLKIKPWSDYIQFVVGGE